MELKKFNPNDENIIASNLNYIHLFFKILEKGIEKYM